MEQQRRELWERIYQDNPQDVEARFALAWCLYDDARLLRAARRPAEALAEIDRATVIVEGEDRDARTDRDWDFVLRLLADGARLQLELGDVAAYQNSCQALVEHCRRRNCVTFGPLRVCLLRGDATDDPLQLVELTKDAASRGSTSLRKRTNVGGACSAPARTKRRFANCAVSCR